MRRERQVADDHDQSYLMTAPPALITEQRQVDALCGKLSDAGEFAFDTEFIRDDTFEARLCLIQVSTGNEVQLIDPTAEVDVSEFWRLVTDPSLLKIVHAGKEDFDVCVTACGQPPRNVFDVQIAAGFVGLGYPLSLLRLAAATVHKRIAKGATLTDWLRRPLTEEQLHYAVDDVAHLPAIRQRLQDQLDQLGRAAWAAEEFLRFENLEHYRIAPEDRVAKMKGTRGFDGLSLLVLRRLVDWRENWAREKNRPIRAMMRDDILVEIAKRRPTRPEQLQVLRGFPQARNPRIIGEILEIIQASKTAPVEMRPIATEVTEELPMTRVVVDLLGAVLRATCVAEQMEPDLVATNQRLRDLLAYHERQSGDQPLLLTGWRKKFIGDRLLDVVEGRMKLHLDGWPKEPLLILAKR